MFLFSDWAMGKDDLDFLGCFRLETCSPMMQPKKDGQRPISAGRCGKGGGDLFFLVWGGLSRVCLWRCGRLPEGINHCQTAQRRCQTPVPCAVYSFLAVSVLGGHVFYWYEDSIESGMCPIENSVWTCVDHWMIECFRLVIGWKWRCCPRSCKSSGSY